MEIVYEKREAMTFIGFHTSIRPGEGFQKCPEFWDKEYNEKYARLLRTMIPENPVEEAILANEIGAYAICADSPDGFDYWIAGLYRGTEVPEGLELYRFPAGDWASFRTKGPMPDALQELTRYVWEEWLPSEGEKRKANDRATVEFYSDGDMQSPDYESGILVPLGDAGLPSMIAFCGLDCSKCDAFLATVRDDEELRIQTAKKWSAWNGVEIPPEQIRCEGCLGNGVKTVYCDSLCAIRKCAAEKKLVNCAGCPGWKDCGTLQEILANSPEAKRNLEKEAGKAE